MQAIANQQPWYKDPLAVRKPWNEAEYDLIDHGNGGKLCFAILWDDKHMLPHPPVIRGLEETTRALLSAGHKGNMDATFSYFPEPTHCFLDSH